WRGDERTVRGWPRQSGAAVDARKLGALSRLHPHQEIARREPMGIKVGMVGVGSFAQCFIPLFKAHPLVDKVILCDLDAAKLKSNCEKYEIPDSCPSLDALCETDVDAAVIITQHWLHAPQAVQALKAGKHVYSAVPTGVTVEEIAGLVQTVKETGK